MKITKSQIQQIVESVVSQITEDSAVKFSPWSKSVYKKVDAFLREKKSNREIGAYTMKYSDSMVGAIVTKNSTGEELFQPLVKLFGNTHCTTVENGIIIQQ